MRPVRIALVGFALAVAATTAASAQSRVRVGVLDCRGGTNVGLIFGSQTTMNCLFNSGRSSYPYVATVSRLGLDVGIPNNVSMAWGVFAPNNRIWPGDLAGGLPGRARLPCRFGGGATY